MNDPQNTIAVVKNPQGKEVGRIAVTAKNASQYIQGLVEAYGGGSVDYIEDKDAAMISRMLSGPRP